MDADLEEQQYLFDLNGFLVIENVLGPGEIAELNAMIDAQDLPPPSQRSPRFGTRPAQSARPAPAFCSGASRSSG